MPEEEQKSGRDKNLYHSSNELQSYLILFPLSIKKEEEEDWESKNILQTPVWYNDSESCIYIFFAGAACLLSHDIQIHNG